MAVVWQHDEITVRAVHDLVNAQDPRQRAYTTFMTVMGRQTRHATFTEPDRHLDEVAATRYG